MKHNSLFKMALVLVIVLMPSLVNAGEKKLLSIQECKEMGYVAANDSVYDMMYSLAITCIGADYEYAEFKHLANVHKDWEEDILNDCASYRTVMEVCRFYFKQPVFFSQVNDKWDCELSTLTEYWLKYDPSDKFFQEIAEYD